MRRIFGITAISALLSGVIAGAAPAQEPNARVLQKLRALTGTYTGRWSMYGISKAGKIERKMSWTDTITASDPRVEGKRAFVKTSAVMTFSNKQIPPFKMEGKEGYLLNKDGTPGSYFIETFGRTYRMIQVGKGVWSYTTAAGPGELVRLGFPSTATGRHVMVKVVSMEQGKEFHRITRISIVRWKGEDGAEKTLSYVSLSGHHVRMK